jgi:uncharacterized protein (UPF0147 family)
MPDIRWDYLIDDIREGKCVILLGPEAALHQSGQTFQQLLLTELNPPNNPDIKYYHQEDELFLFTDTRAKGLVVRNISKFYTRQTNEYLPDFYEKLSQIPVYLWINTSPDLVLKKVLEANGNPFDFNFYEKKKEKKEVELPSLAKPLLFNLLGSFEREESLVLTHDDLFAFISSILADNSLPQNLRNALTDARSSLFLGFKFEKWYVQLLIKLLGVPEESLKYAFLPELSVSPTNSSQNNQRIAGETLMRETLKIEFITHHIPEFVQTLYEKCQAENLLRLPIPKPQNTENQMKDVFISYSTKDQAAKDELCQLFDNEGITHWLDETSLNLGGNIVDGINEGLRKTRFTVLLVSENSLLSTWVSHESLFRLKQEVFTQQVSFIPVIIDKIVFDDNFPFEMYDKFAAEIKRQRELRQKAEERQMKTEMYSTRIERLEEILPDVTKIIAKITEGLSANFTEPARKTADLAKLVQTIKKV